MSDTQRNLDRRELLGTMVGAAVAVPALFGAGAAFAQDNPVDCAPIGVAGKTPVPYKPDPTLPVRMRKSAFELNKTEVDRLKSAYDALRKLTKNQPNDPRGWLRQGFVHCWYCGGGSDGKAGAEIHGSWFFFPWHRAYLHFHERILCKLIGDDTFALPYWDWDSQGRQTFPSVYGDPNDRSNPLFDMLRSAKPNAQISRQAVSVGILNRTMNQPRNTLFMGSQNDSGAMENAPHGPVHIWTGDTAMQSVRNDMGVLATAAQDPVFFAHHDNIDRLWSVWLGLAPTHQNFTATAWLNHGWDFYDENSVWTHIKISDVLDQVKSLRSDYAKPSVNPIWKFTPRKPASALVAAAPAEKLAPLVFAAPSAAPTALGTAPITRDITLPQPHAQAFAALSAEAPAQFVLNVRGISVPSDQQAMFNVFLNLPDATPATSTDVPNFVGMVTVLAKSKEGGAHQHAETNAAFDVSDVLGQVKDGGKLAVTLVPVAGEGAPSQDSQATFRQVSIDQL